MVEMTKKKGIHRYFLLKFQACKAQLKKGYSVTWTKRTFLINNWFNFQSSKGDII